MNLPTISNLFTLMLTRPINVACFDVAIVRKIEANLPGALRNSFSGTQDKDPCSWLQTTSLFYAILRKYWNKLPEEIVNASSVETFKLRLDA